MNQIRIILDKKIVILERAIIMAKQLSIELATKYAKTVLFSAYILH